MPARLLAEMVPQARDETPLGPRPGRFLRDRARDMTPVILRADPSLEVFADRAGTEQQQVLVLDLRGDSVEEPFEVLQAVRFACRLAHATAAVPAARVVSHVACRPMMGRDLGLDALDPRSTLQPADDDRLARVDPDQGRARMDRPRGWSMPGAALGHDSAQAGSRSSKTARSPYWTPVACSHATRSTRTACRCVPALKLISGSSRTA